MRSFFFLVYTAFATALVTPCAEVDSQRDKGLDEVPAWVSELPAQMLEWLETVQHPPRTPEEPWGLFTFSQDCAVPYSVYSTAAAWAIADTCGGIDKLPGCPSDAKSRMATFIQGLQDPDSGQFKDPWLEPLRSHADGLPKFRGAVTKYALNILAYCGAKPLYAYSTGGPGGEFNVEKYLAETKSGDWTVPWDIGSSSGLQTHELYWLVNTGHPEYLPALQEGVAFIVSKQNPDTGMWGGSELPLDQQLGGALKVIGRFQFGMGLVVPHMGRLADSLIQHHQDRSFYRDDVPITIPRNVAELVYACTEVSEYRRQELYQVMYEVLDEFRAYRQPDGSFGQRRQGTDAIWWNDAEAVPPSKTRRGDVYGTQAALYAIRNVCEWTGWSGSPWPQPIHWKAALEKRKPKYHLSIGDKGEVHVQTVGD